MQRARGGDMSMTFTEVKEQYPNPIASPAFRDVKPDQYCVGGAICLAMGDSSAHSFPSSNRLAIQLRYYNSWLTYDQSYELACDITNNNDAGDIDGAWDTLEQAMNYKPEEAV